MSRSKDSHFIKLGEKMKYLLKPRFRYHNIDYIYVKPTLLYPHTPHGRFPCGKMHEIHTWECQFQSVAMR